ncbi:MAG: hypothetical protein Q8L90_02310 [Bacteroidota bacterium]|nr:hypothetical protein [Bacteroidota bacterium]
MKKLLLENDEVRIELELGILIAKWKNSFVDLNIAQQAVVNRLEATDFIPYPMVIDIKSIKSITKPSRDFLASEKGCQGIIAAAFLIDSSLGRILGNFFIQINKPLRPTKIFTNEIKAKKWLSKYIKKD